MALHSTLEARRSSVQMPPLHALLLRNGDDDASLELELLQLWTATDPERIPTELLALDDKCWRRLGLLLFASDSSLVLALVAALERVATEPSISSSQFFRRVWQSQWREHLHEKVVDCHARLEREGIRSGRTDSLSGRSGGPDGLDRRDQNGGNDAPKVMEVVDLLLSLSTTVDRTPAIARAASMGLQRLLSLKPHPFSALMTTHICRSTALQHYVTWLLGDDESDLPSPSERSGRNRHECDHVYLELLVAAAAVARPDANKRRGTRSSVFDDTAAMLQMCTLGVASTDSSIQYSALCLLCSLLVLDDASSSALSSAVRLSGILISISWLLNHTVTHIAAMAATTLELIIRHSPPSDILRAVIEQGCVIIYRMLLSASSGATKPAVAASCRSLLNWVTEEVAWQSGVIAASVQSIMSSTNVLLQKNIVLTLQILAQRNAAIREALEDQDFRTDALVTAIQADDEAGLAVSLLSICLNCCGKCSTLKIEGCARDSNVFQGDNSNEQQEEERTPDSRTDEQDFIIQLRCADGEFVKATAVLLREHSNLLRGWKAENPTTPRGITQLSLPDSASFGRQVSSTL
ncbi:Armadillo-type fold [Phytophthora cactorum]|nr:Armadillo-type fold [Phytophthora cactorum]